MREARAAVAVVKCGGYARDEAESAVRRLFALLNAGEGLAASGPTAFVKSNAVLASDPSGGMVTHPEVVRAVVVELQRAGASVIIGDSPGGPFTPAYLKRVYEKTGLARVAAETGAELSLDTRTVEVPLPQGAAVKRITLCRRMVEADLLVSVSKLKSHRFMNVTGPVKNLYGTVPGLTKMAYHSHFEQEPGFSDLLLDAYLAASPDFHVLDAVEVVEGDGARRGRLRHMGMLGASFDGFALEAAALRLAGLDPSVSKPLAAAMRRGLCPRGGDWPELLGDDPEPLSLNPPFDLPRENVFGEKWLARVSRRWVRLFAATPRPVPGACTLCGRCAELCPRGAIRMGRKAALVDLSRCIRCFCCDELCEFKAIEIRQPLPARLLRSTR